MIPVQIYLQPALVERLNYACEQTGLTKAELIRKLLRQIEKPDVCRDRT